MNLTYFAYLASGICLIGIAWRMHRWFVVAMGPESAVTSPISRLAAAARATAGALSSPGKLSKILGVLIGDVLLQRQIARQNWVRWLMHMGLFYGLVLLVLLHALDDLILVYWVDDYASTVNPFMFVRNLLGLFLLIGVVIAMIRRKKIPLLRRFNSRTDRLTLVLLSLILFSGIALEAVQIISESIFDEMVVDYMGSDDPQEIAALQAHWAAEFDVAFKKDPDVEAEGLEMGRQLHMDYCAACHSSPKSAFVAYPVARMLKPIGGMLDRHSVDTWLWYFHYLVSCLALAYLPFGKFFHLVSVPLSLAVKALGSTQDNRPENRPARRMMGLDACTHCGVCSTHCSVGPIMAVIENPTILPSEKTGAVSGMSLGRMSTAQHRELAQGSDICTACGRCTDVCPSGIDLQDMWLSSNHDLVEKDFEPPDGWIRSRTMVAWAESTEERGASDAGDENPQPNLGLADNPDTFWACVQCTTCTNVCPVVAASDNPRRDLDLTPQQVMNLMRLELKHMALGCRMVWDCVTCYKCQEHCPQGVPVADVLYELRNEACRRLRPDRDSEKRKTPGDAKKDLP